MARRRSSSFSDLSRDHETKITQGVLARDVIVTVDYGVGFVCVIFVHKGRIECFHDGVAVDEVTFRRSLDILGKVWVEPESYYRATIDMARPSAKKLKINMGDNEVRYLAVLPRPEAEDVRFVIVVYRQGAVMFFIDGKRMEQQEFSLEIEGFEGQFPEQAVLFNRLWKKVNEIKQYLLDPRVGKAGLWRALTGLK